MAAYLVVKMVREIQIVEADNREQAVKEACESGDWTFDSDDVKVECKVDPETGDPIKPRKL